MEELESSGLLQEENGEESTGKDSGRKSPNEDANGSDEGVIRLSYPAFVGGINEDGTLVLTGKIVHKTF